MKLVTEETCPHCKKNFESEKDIEHLEPSKITGTIKEIKTDSNQTMVQEVKAVEPKIEIKTVAPKDQPFFTCKNCGDSHKNPNYTEIPKFRCKNGNCGTLNGKKTCKNCGNKNPEEFEEEDIDSLKEIGIPEPTHADHDHEGE